jgi:hypothetical protein
VRSEVGLKVVALSIELGEARLALLMAEGDLLKRVPDGVG